MLHIDAISKAQSIETVIHYINDTQQTTDEVAQLHGYETLPTGTLQLYDLDEFALADYAAAQYVHENGNQGETTLTEIQGRLEFLQQQDAIFNLDKAFVIAKAFAKIQI